MSHLRDDTKNKHLESRSLAGPLKEGLSLQSNNRLLIALVAGEQSGDILGADLMKEIKNEFGVCTRFIGLGGSLMEKQGLNSPFSLEEVAVMGPLSVLRRLPSLIKRLKQMVDLIVSLKPDLLVIIDSPEFTHPIARRVRSKLPNTPIVNYVPPSVWAWRPGRAKRMRSYIDHVLALFPFEPAAYQSLSGPECTYVGHPLVQRIDWIDRIEPQAFARSLGISREALVVVVLPGSRESEVSRLMGVFGQTISRIMLERPNLCVLIPVVPAVKNLVAKLAKNWPTRPILIEGDEGKYSAFRLARGALAASGTVTLELALAGVPMAVGYRIDPVAALFRFLVNVPSIVLPNLILGESVFPEFVHTDCRFEKLFIALNSILDDGPHRDRQLVAMSRVREVMCQGNPLPGQLSVQILAQCFAGRRLE